VSFVYFLAFDVGGSNYLKSYQHSYEFLSNNIKIMEYTFAELKKKKIPFIFASSQMSNMTHSPYGILKSIGETYTRALKGLIVKFWNVYGVEYDPKKFHVITDFINMALTSKEIKMQTDGSEKRQFLHADDCSECLLKLSKIYHDIHRDKNLHITSYKWNSIYEVALIVSKIIGKEIKITPSKVSDIVQAGYLNEPDPYILNFWRPKIDLEEGIGKVIDELRFKR
jgi:nucleoside-diphosphate-sugar epimerase